METRLPRAHRGASRTLLAIAGAIFVAGAALHNTWFVSLLQLSDPERLSAPQRVIVSYAAARDIPLIDLLPPLVEYAHRAQVAPERLFLDHDHLSMEGHRMAAELLAGTIATYARQPDMRSSP